MSKYCRIGSKSTEAQPMLRELGWGKFCGNFICNQLFPFLLQSTDFRWVKGEVLQLLLFCILKY